MLYVDFLKNSFYWENHLHVQKKKKISPILSIQFSEYLFIKLSNHHSPILDHFLHPKELSHTHSQSFTMLPSSLSNH